MARKRRYWLVCWTGQAKEPGTGWEHGSLTGHFDRMDRGALSWIEERLAKERADKGYSKPRITFTGIFPLEEWTDA